MLSSSKTMTGRVSRLKAGQPGSPSVTKPTQARCIRSASPWGGSDPRAISTPGAATQQAAHGRRAPGRLVEVRTAFGARPRLAQRFGGHAEHPVGQHLPHDVRGGGAWLRLPVDLGVVRRETRLLQGLVGCFVVDIAAQECEHHVELLGRGAGHQVARRSDAGAHGLDRFARHEVPVDEGGQRQHSPSASRDRLKVGGYARADRAEASLSLEQTLNRDLAEFVSREPDAEVLGRGTSGLGRLLGRPHQRHRSTHADGAAQKGCLRTPRCCAAPTPGRPASRGRRGWRHRPRPEGNPRRRAGS